VESGTQRGRIIFTFGVGAVAVLVLLSLGSRLTPKEPEATPTPTERATATPLSPDAFHATLTARPGDPSLTVGTMATVSLVFRNAGTATWTKGTKSELHLAVKDNDTTLSTNGMAVAWPWPDRPAVQQEASVKPGESATFTFQVKGVKAGTFKVALRPVCDGVTWLEDPNLSVTITVR
jgi:hypothetical protein